MCRKKLGIVWAAALFLCVCMMGICSWSSYVNAGTVEEETVSGAVEWNIDDNGVLTVTGEGDLKKNLNLFPWDSRREEIQSAVLNWTGMSDLRNLFYGCKNLSSVDLNGLDTSNVTDMCNMFCGCRSLTTLDVRNFDTSNVTNMACMFSDCTNLTELDVRGFDTANVTDMGGIFQLCRSLTDLDVSGFDTKNVTDMVAMFNMCRSLKNIDVTGFNTTGVTNMRSMFSECESLTALDVSRFDTKNVTDMQWMFNFCSGLTTLDVSSFNMTNVKNIDRMFFRCSSLTRLKMPANFAAEVELPGKGWKDENGNAVSVAAILPVPMTYSKGLSETGGSGGSNLQIGGTTPPASVGETITDEKTAGIYTVISADTAAYAGSMSQAKNVTVPDTITNEKGTFKVTEIAPNAFKGNKKMTSITIGKNITKIGKNAFFGCKSLKKIKVKTKSLKSVKKNALKGIHKKCKIKVPAAKLKDYQKKFKKKGQKASVKITK